MNTSGENRSVNPAFRNDYGATISVEVVLHDWKGALSSNGHNDLRVDSNPDKAKDNIELTSTGKEHKVEIEKQYDVLRAGCNEHQKMATCSSKDNEDQSQIQTRKVVNNLNNVENSDVVFDYSNHDGEYLDSAEPRTKEPVAQRDTEIDNIGAMTVIKYTCSVAFLIFSIILIMAVIFSGQTKLAQDIHPVFAFFVLCVLVLWLAIMEGGQGCLVGLQPVDKEMYKESHPITLKSTSLAHKGDNMERFIVGRQFLVVLVVFVINLSGAALPASTVLGLPAGLLSIFLGSGLALILMTIILGQLTAQVNAANCMLDFINTYFVVFTTYISLAIEFCGLLHSVYLVQYFFSILTSKPLESNEPPRNVAQTLFFWSRVLLSLVILGFAFAVTLEALFTQKTTMWDGVPPAASVVIFFILMCFVGLMEGMQIALFAVLNLPEEEVSLYPIAYKNCMLAFYRHNLQALLIGRQICVTICMFVIARITTLSVEARGGMNIFGVSDSVQELFNTGLLGALITTIVASLVWRIIASSFPLQFLSNPLMYIIIRLCLILESSGICSAAWLLARIHKTIAGYQDDQVYIIGTSEHQAAAKTDDADAQLSEDGRNKELHDIGV